MAEMNPQSPDKKSGKIRPVKKSTRVDLTPMVDLGFLLITFFVFTTTMSKPTVMKVNIPYDKIDENNEVCYSCVLTVQLGSNNSIRYFAGNDTSNIKTCGYEAIRDVIQQKKAAVQLARKVDNQMVLIIQPGKDCSFQNFVDLTDEVTINNIKRYYIDDANE